MSRRNAKVIAGVIAAVAVLAYLHDPPWIGGVTSGMRGWDYSLPDTVFRWTNGRASMFIPGEATAVMIPLRSGFPGPHGGPVSVEIAVDGRFLSTVTLTDPESWVRQELPLGRRATHRRFRRIDLRVNRVIGQGLLGVMTGPPTIW
jgi:hypothetical protein